MICDMYEINLSLMSYVSHNNTLINVSLILSIYEYIPYGSCTIVFSFILSRILLFSTALIICALISNGRQSNR
jgi:hypothetical protein